MIPVEVARGVVVNINGDILVVKQKPFSTWSLPKGHVEAGEDLLTTAKREIYEESGVSSLECLDNLGSFQRTGGVNNKKFKNITIFLFKTKQTDLKPIDPKNPEARWVKRGDVANLLTRVEDKKFWLSVKDRVEKLCV